MNPTPKQRIAMDTRDEERARCAAIVAALVRHLQTSGASGEVISEAQMSLVDIRSGKVLS